MQFEVKPGMNFPNSAFPRPAAVITVFAQYCSLLRFLPWLGNYDFFARSKRKPSRKTGNVAGFSLPVQSESLLPPFGDGLS